MNRRLPGIAAILLAIAGLTIADRDSDPIATDDGSRAAVGASQAPMPVTYPTGSLRSTWFCAGGTAAAGSGADHRVTIANPTDEDTTAAITVFAGTTDTDPQAADIAALPPAVTTLDVPSRSRAQVRLGDVLDAPFAAALVEVAGGDVAVEHSVGGGVAASSAPCASSPSSTWYFAGGSTARGAQDLVALFNPFPDNAVVDVTMATTDGFRSPQQYEGFVVPGQELVVLDLGGAIARHNAVSTSIVARSGRVVADRIQTFDGSAVPSAVTVALGAPTTAPVWVFPEGQVADGLGEAIAVYNPSDAQAEVDVEIRLDDPATNGQVDPVPMSIPPRAALTLSLDEEQRVPPGVAHTTTVRSINGTPVVAERLVVGSSPAPRRGVAYTLGSPMAATEWLFPVGAATTDVAEFVVIANPSSDTIARVSFVALAQGQTLEIEGLQDVEVPAGGRAVVELGEHVNRNDLPLLVTASAAIVAERGLYAASGNGLTLAIGTPVGATAVAL